jgi:sugar phosphate isomerase/epimerase
VETTLKLCCQEHLMPGASFEERFTKLREVGFTATEVEGRQLWTHFEEIKEASRVAELPVAAICSGFRGCLLDADTAERQRAANDLKKLLAMCHAFGRAHIVVPPIFGEPRLPDLRPFMDPVELEDAVLVPTLREIVDECPTDTSCILLEPLNRYEQHYLRTLADGVRVATLTNRDRVRIVADVFHMNIEERDPYAALRENIGYVLHVHLADSTRLEPGTGTIDFERYGEVLRSAGFAGACSLECDLSGEAYTALKNSAQFLSKALLGN